MVEGSLYVVRLHKVDRKDSSGNVVRTQTFPEVLVANAYGDSLQLTQMQPRRNGLGIDQREFSGKRIPALPARPGSNSARPCRAHARC